MTTFRLLESDLLHSAKLRRLVPAGIKARLKRQIRYAEYRSEQLRREAKQRLGNPIPAESTYDSPYPLVLGIFSDNSYTYVHNIAACQDLKVRFRVLDLTASDWLPHVVDSGCDVFMATPSTLLGIWRRMYEERLWLVSEDLKKRLCPTFKELFLWESKRRMRDWLVAHGIPHPRTWVFYDRDQAMDFCHDADYPLVCKTDSGAASTGVFVLRGRRQAAQMVDLAFSRGLLGRSADAREREYGSILLQEYVTHDFEWRIVRIGDHFMCRRKVREGDYASGSGDIGWAAPLPGMLDFAHQVTEVGGFRSMTVDMFENTTGHHGAPYLVNELQTIFGPIVREDNTNAHTGRWQFNPNIETWSFEPGYFYQNACANLRVQMLLGEYGSGLLGPKSNH